MATKVPSHLYTRVLEDCKLRRKVGLCVHGHIYIERMSDLFSVEMGTMIYTHAIVQFSLSVLVPGNDVITEIQTVIPINALIIETEQHMNFLAILIRLGIHRTIILCIYLHEGLFTFLVCL